MEWLKQTNHDFTNIFFVWWEDLKSLSKFQVYIFINYSQLLYNKCPKQTGSNGLKRCSLVKMMMMMMMPVPRKLTLLISMEKHLWTARAILTTIHQQAAHSKLRLLYFVGIRCSQRRRLSYQLLQVEKSSVTSGVSVSRLNGEVIFMQFSHIWKEIGKHEKAEDCLEDCWQNYLDRAATHKPRLRSGEKARGASPDQRTLLSPAYQGAAGNRAGKNYQQGDIKRLGARKRPSKNITPSWKRKIGCPG